MRKKLVLLVLLTSVTINANSQNFSTWSGTIRFSGGLLGGMMVFAPTMTAGIAYAAAADKSYGADIPGWIRNNHLSFLRFFNAGYDFLIPQWSMAFSNDEIIVDQRVSGKDNLFNDLFFWDDHYINYMGYYLNWKDPFSRFGFYCGADYELRTFGLEYKSITPGQYHYWSVHNEIQSLVPSVGIRYRLISPEREIEGLPINIVLETGLSYAFVLNFKNKVTSTDALNNYSTDALNNGFRSSLGMAITTNKWGSLYVRWIKDLYNLYNNDNIAKDSNGYLYNNEVKSSISYFSIGYSTFL